MISSSSLLLRIFTFTQNSLSLFYMSLQTEVWGGGGGGVLDKKAGIYLHRCLWISVSYCFTALSDKGDKWLVQLKMMFTLQICFLLKFPFQCMFSCEPKRIRIAAQRTRWKGNVLLWSSWHYLRLLLVWGLARSRHSANVFWLNK